MGAVPVSDVRYLIACTVSSVGGLVVGLTVRAILDGILHCCRLVRDLPHKSMVIGGAVVLVGAISTVMLFKQGQELDRQREYTLRVTECQARANEAFRDSLARRSEASRGQLNAQIKQIGEQIEQNVAQAKLLIETRGQGSITTGPSIVVYLDKLNANTQALREVQATLIKTQNARDQNPYPPLKCDGVQ